MQCRLAKGWLLKRGIHIVLSRCNQQFCTLYTDTQALEHTFEYQFFSRRGVLACETTGCSMCSEVINKQFKGWFLAWETKYKKQWCKIYSKTFKLILLENSWFDQIDKKEAVKKMFNGFECKQIKFRKTIFINRFNGNEVVTKYYKLLIINHNTNFLKGYIFIKYLSNSNHCQECVKLSQ